MYEKVKLDKIEDEDLRSNLIALTQDSYFGTDDERISYIDDVLGLKEKGANIEYLFSDVLDNYNPKEKIHLVNAFYELEFSNKIIDALLKKLAEAENKKDADEDGFSNISEITGLDEFGNPLPFEEAGKMIKDLGPIVDPFHINKFAEEAGALDIPDEYKTVEQKEKEAEKNRINEEKERKVKEKLKESSLTTDPLTIDIYKSVEDSVDVYASSDAKEENRDRVTTSIVEDLVNKDPKKIETKDSSEVLNSIKDELKEKRYLKMK